MKKHVVILPGYYGSNLLDQKSNVRFWLSTFTFQKPEHTLAGIALPASDGRVFVDGIVDDVEILKIFKIPVYHPLIKFLVHGMGYYGSNLLDQKSNVRFWLSTFTFQKPEHTLAGIALPET